MVSSKGPVKAAHALAPPCLPPPLVKRFKSSCFCQTRMGAWMSNLGAGESTTLLAETRVQPKAISDRGSAGVSPISVGPELTQEAMGARTEEDLGLGEMMCVPGMLVVVVRGGRQCPLRLLHPLAPSSSPSC